ncbi:F-box protein At1g61340 [Capsella rubella]|nr:F-box protein At1g61340 [Capsella rubella]
MALGKKRIVTQKSNLKNRRDVGDLGLGLEFVQYKRGFGRKRILISSSDEIEDSVLASPVGRSSSKKLCDKVSSLVGDCQSRELEDLPQDILVRIICGVEHEDLKQLCHVSKTMKEATLIAKQLHFAYSTPRKTSSFHHGRFGWDKPFDAENDDEEIEAPGAPLQKRYRLSRVNHDKDDSGVSVALFN